VTDAEIKRRIQKQLDKRMPGLRVYVVRTADNPNKHRVYIDVMATAYFAFDESERSHLSDYLNGHVASVLDDLADHMEALRQ
jgi:hypothetical protein